MRPLLLSVLYLVVSATCVPTVLAQKIFAHNDYAQPQPLVAAYEQRADFIEADVWLLNGKLVVSHDQPLPNAPSLDSLYLKPITSFFSQNKDRSVSSDRSYTFGLIIDVKDNPIATLPVLLTLLQEKMVYYNRTANPMAIQVIISGNRPRIDQFFDYPLLFQFDGRPSEVYDDETLKRIAMVSDNFRSYSRWDGLGDLPDIDREKLKRVIKRAHSDNKPIRFWAIPDTPNAWKQLKKLGVDILSTDHVAACVQAMR